MHMGYRGYRGMDVSLHAVGRAKQFLKTRIQRSTLMFPFDSQSVLGDNITCANTLDGENQGLGNIESLSMIYHNNPIRV